MTGTSATTEVSATRLNLLRAAYFVLAAGLGLFIWPTILDPSRPMASMGGVVVSMLGAMSALAVLGVFRPLQMLPVLLFEIAWKTIWLVRVALPAWLGDGMDPATLARFYECIPVVIFVAIIPGGHVWRTYVAGRRTQPARA